MRPRKPSSDPQDTLVTYSGLPLNPIGADHKEEGRATAKLNES